MRRALRVLALALLALVVLVVVVVATLWYDRPDVEDLGLRAAPAASATAPLTATWLGVTTILFDDGETQLLVDAYFTRPSELDYLLDREIAPDEDTVAAALAEAGVDRLAAVVPAHSHFDHALDVAAVANATGALVLGTETTAHLARGGGVPDDRVRVVADGETVALGRFALRFVASPHAPLVDGGPPHPGHLEAPLVPPAPLSSWVEGGSWSLVVEHPAATVVVHASAGFAEGALAGVAADAVFLGVGGLSRLGQAHAVRYWREVVAATGAPRVLPVHLDDLFAARGEVRCFPRAIDDVERSAGWLRELAGLHGVALQRPVLGRPLELP